MADRWVTFINGATLNTLREKLRELNCPTSGSKAVVKQRLQEAVQGYSGEELNNLVPDDFDEGHPNAGISDDDADEDHAHAGIDSNSVGEESSENEDDIDVEIQRLRTIVRKKKEIAKLKQELQSHLERLTREKMALEAKIVELSCYQTEIVQLRNELTRLQNIQEKSNNEIQKLTHENDGTPCVTPDWDKYLAKIEFSLNNTLNRSTGFTPSMLLFGRNQKGQFCDALKEYLEQNLNQKQSDLNAIRKQAGDNIKNAQNYNEKYYNKIHKQPRVYEKNDYVMIKNFVNFPGVNKKLLARYKGPYEIVEVLPNDRYVIKDIEGMQVSRIPYKGVCASSNMRPYIVVGCDAKYG